MECMRKLWSNFLIWILLLFVGCNQVDTENELLVEKERENKINDQTITIDFEILNKPILDESVIISLLFRANDSSKKLFLNYSSVTEDDISFGDNQIDKFELSSSLRGIYPEQQVMIIPRREGRVFFVVSATIKFDKENVTKTISIPIDVDKSNNSRD
tara:strand:+ start:128 stop:601 length:474 start_codon:yes stop_codon:yes gene_type:complete